MHSLFSHMLKQLIRFDRLDRTHLLWLILRDIFFPDVNLCSCNKEDERKYWHLEEQTHLNTFTHILHSVWLLCFFCVKKNYLKTKLHYYCIMSDCFFCSCCILPGIFFFFCLHGSLVSVATLVISLHSLHEQLTNKVLESWKKEILTAFMLLRFRLEAVFISC